MNEEGSFLSFSKPEFEYLAKSIWVGTEKIDGTNIRIGWDGEKAELGEGPTMHKFQHSFIPSFKRLPAPLNGQNTFKVISNKWFCWRGIWQENTKGWKSIHSGWRGLHSF